MNNKAQHILVIGGVAGGASAAARVRRHSESAQITIIERSEDVSFANCGLPYYIGGEITERSRLAVQTPESLKTLLNLNVLTRTEAISINRTEKMIKVKSVDGKVSENISYNQLILAPGASPIRPPLEGINDERILALRNLQDMDQIKLAASETKSVLIVGAGFIGLEMAEQLQRLGMSVSIVELQPQILPQLDAEMVRTLETEIQEQGIELTLGNGIEGFESQPDGVIAHLASGKTKKAGLVVLSIGVRPESGLAKDAGLKLGSRGHIVVNKFQQTSDPNIYAVGDVCETFDPILEKQTAIPLGGPANRQGRTAADHIFLGEQALPYSGSIGTAIVRVFDLVAGIAGYNEKRLVAEKVPYEKVTITGNQHAGYYPGAVNITLKLLWSPHSGKLLGVQSIGADGVDKRLDVIATALKGNLTIDDLAHLELAYAPPFGNAKDPINIAGFAACNIRDGFLIPEYSLPDENQQIIDVRPAEIAQLRPVPGALNIPFGQLRLRLGEIDKERRVYTICQLGKTSYFASRVLQLNGYDARSIIGGVAVQLPAEPVTDGADTEAKPVESSPATTTSETVEKLDCTGLACPGPIMRVKEAVENLESGCVLEVRASDRGFRRDLPAFCTVNGHDFLGATTESGITIGRLKKKSGAISQTEKTSNNDVSLVVFSQEMDKALAALVIANGAIAMGGQATIFFTFWGLNVLRKHEAPQIKGKTLMDKLFSFMLPQGVNRFDYP